MLKPAILMAGLLAAPAAAQLGAPPPAAFRAWLAEPDHRSEFRAFQRYLRRAGVLGVLPTEHLLRTSTSWRTCGTPFEVPPRAFWPRIVPTLRFIRAEVRPRVGPVAAVSGYRNPLLNRCAGGAPRSAHTGFWGVDLVPVAGIDRETLFERLCALHRELGPAARFGLGFYGGVRFHVDTKSYRLWGADHRRGSSPCA